MDWNDDDPEEQETGPVAVARSLSGADEEQETPAPQPASKAPTELEQVAAEDDGSQYARPVQQATSGPNDETLDPEQQYSRPSAGGDGEESPAAGPKAPTLPVAPQYADNADNYRALEKQMSGFDPANYKPSVGRRILAGLAGGAVAFGGRDGSPTVEKVLNRPLARAQQEQQAKVAPIQQRINDVNSQNQRQQQQFGNDVTRFGLQERDMTNQARIADWNAQAQQRKEQAQVKLNTVDKNTLGPVDPNNPFGEWQGKTPGGQVVRGLEPPAAIQKSPAFIRQQRVRDLSEMDRNGIKLTPEDRKFYFANGKLSEPSEHTSYIIRENPDGSPVAPRGGGQAPKGIPELIAKNMQDKDAFSQQWERQPDGSYVNHQTLATITGQEFNSRIEKFRTDLNANANLRKAGYWVDATGKTVAPGETGLEHAPQPTGHAPSQPQQPAAAAPQQQAPQAPQTARVQSGKTIKVGDPVTANGKTGIVTGINPQSGKPIVRWQTGAQ